MCFSGLLQVQLNDVILNTAIDIHGKGAPIGKAANNGALLCLQKQGKISMDLCIFFLLTMLTWLPGLMFAFHTHSSHLKMWALNALRIYPGNCNLLSGFLGIWCIWGKVGHVIFQRPGHVILTGKSPLFFSSQLLGLIPRFERLLFFVTPAATVVMCVSPHCCCYCHYTSLALGLPL